MKSNLSKKNSAMYLKPMLEPENESTPPKTAGYLHNKIRPGRILDEKGKDRPAASSGE
jgi:hypothetical protein